MKTAPHRPVARTPLSAPRSSRSPRRIAFLSAALLLSSVVPAQADNITLTTSNTASGQSGFITGGHWSNGDAPSLDNDYFVNNGFTLRTPQNAAATSAFGGNSLTINASILGMANLQASNNTTINNLTLTAGASVVNMTSSLKILSGDMTISGSAFVRLHTVAAEAARNITFASHISGSGSVRLMQKGTLALTGTDNTFSGIWTVGGTNVTIIGVSYTNTASLTSTLNASAAGSLGINSSVVADAYGVFRVGYDWTTTGSLTLLANSQVFLDTHWTVSALSISGTALAPGTYDYEYLKDNYAAFFADGGTGSITVSAIPEPSAYALFASVALFGFSTRRRRRR